MLLADPLCQCRTDLLLPSATDERADQNEAATAAVRSLKAPLIRVAITKITICEGVVYDLSVPVSSGLN